MSSDVHASHEGCACTLSLPDHVDAGGYATVVVSWSCPEGCDLAGSAVAILDEQGVEVATAELAADGRDDADEDGDAPVTASAELQFPVPPNAGDYRYRAVLLPGADADESVAHAPPPEPFTLTVVAHALSLNAWGLPSAIAVGEAFEFKVGVKCSSACDLAGRKVRLVDAGGRKLAEAALGADHWPGTAALHYATIAARAPAEPGRQVLQLRVAPSRGVPPHAARTIDLPLNVVPEADCEVVVEAVDSEQQAPIANARVILHPYRAVTGPDGRARLRVARGEYRMQVSGSKYLAVSQPLSVAGRVSTRAELMREPPPRSPDDGY